MLSPAGPWRTTTIVDTRAETPNAVTLRLALDEPLRHHAGIARRRRVTRSAPPGHVRPVGRLSPDDIPLPIADDVTAYICGSSGFADAASDALMDVGVPVERIRVERFGPTG